MFASLIYRDRPDFGMIKSSNAVTSLTSMKSMFFPSRSGVWKTTFQVLLLISVKTLKKKTHRIKYPTLTFSIAVTLQLRGKISIRHNLSPKRPDF